MKIKADFTNNGTPVLGLTPTIRIRELPNTLVVTDAAMSEAGDGTYFYEYAGYNARKDYTIRCDGGAGLSDTDRYKYAGNESYYEDMAHAVWNDCLSDYVSGAGRNQQLQSFAGNVHLDTATIHTGTVFPIGTIMKASNNLTDALAIANVNGIRVLCIHSDLTIGAGQNISSMAIETLGIMGTDIILSPGCSAANSVFRYASLSGTVTNGDVLLIESCQIGNLDNFTGIMNVVSLSDGSEISIGYWANMIGCTAGGDPGNEPEIIIGTGSLNLNGYTGNLKVTGKTGTGRTVLNFDSGNLIVDSTCVSGTIQVLGVSLVEDNSGPNCNVDVDAVLSNEYIADQVWDENVSEHMNSSSYSMLLQRIVGLMHENIYIDTPIYDGDGNLTSARVRLYSVPASVGTVNDVIGTYEITAPGNGAGKFQTWKQIKV